MRLILKVSALPNRGPQFLLGPCQSNLLAIGVIIRQRTVYLSKSQMGVFRAISSGVRPVLCRQGNSADAQTGTGDFRPATTNGSVAADQSADFGVCRHEFNLPPFFLSDFRRFYLR